jgi:adenylyltransferase/sulfurtransferase
MNYEWFCNKQMTEYQDIDGATFDQLRHSPDIQIMDVRNLHEMPRVTEFEHLRIPLAELEQNLHQIDPARPLVIFCQTGVRSITAAHMIAEQTRARTIYNLKGGIIKWKTQR